MEPPKTKVIILYTHIRDIQKRHIKTWISGVGKEAEFHDDFIGYYILLQGSHEMLCVGLEEPRLRVGQRVKISITPIE